MKCSRAAVLASWLALLAGAWAEKSAFTPGLPFPGLPVLKLHEFNPLVKFGQDATPETDAGKDAKQPQPLLSPKSAYSCLPLPTLLAGYALRSQLPAVECDAATDRLGSLRMRCANATRLALASLDTSKGKVVHMAKTALAHAPKPNLEMHVAALKQAPHALQHKCTEVRHACQHAAGAAATSCKSTGTQLLQQASKLQHALRTNFSLPAVQKIESLAPIVQSLWSNLQSIARTLAARGDRACAAAKDHLQKSCATFMVWMSARAEQGGRALETAKRKTLRAAAAGLEAGREMSSVAAAHAMYHLNTTVPKAADHFAFTVVPAAYVYVTDASRYRAAAEDFVVGLHTRGLLLSKVAAADFSTLLQGSAEFLVAIPGKLVPRDGVLRVALKGSAAGTVHAYEGIRSWWSGLDKQTLPKKVVAAIPIVFTATGMVQHQMAKDSALVPHLCTCDEELCSWCIMGTKFRLSRAPAAA